MRFSYLSFLLLTICACNQDLYFNAINGEETIVIDNSITIAELIEKSEDFRCDGFSIIGSESEMVDVRSAEFFLYAKCPKSIVSQSAKLPVYGCNGFRENSINLCDDNMINIDKLREFYLNPQRRADLPETSRNATLQVVVEGQKSLRSIFPILRKLNTLLNEVDFRTDRDFPLRFSLQTTNRDSSLIPPPPVIQAE